METGSLRHFYSLFFNQIFWLTSAIVVVATLVIYWVLRPLILFNSNRIALYSEHQHVRATAILVEILRSTSQPLPLIFSLLIALKFANLPDSWSATIAHG